MPVFAATSRMVSPGSFAMPNDTRSRGAVEPALLQLLGDRADLRFARAARRATRIARVLELDHPARVLDRQRARLVEQCHVLRRERELGRRQVIGELLRLLRADDDAGDEWLRELPRQRDARDRRVR